MQKFLCVECLIYVYCIFVPSTHRIPAFCVGIMYRVFVSISVSLHCTFTGQVFPGFGGKAIGGGGGYGGGYGGYGKGKIAAKHTHTHSVVEKKGMSQVAMATVGIETGHLLIL